MKCVGIITINDNNNYGNRLQNYAVIRIINGLKFDCKNITIKKNNNVFKHMVKYILKKDYRNLVKRGKYFKNFNKYIQTKDFYDLINLKSNFSFFVVGSDQVWNPNFGRLSDLDLLNFADNNQKISFSASFGVSKLPNDKREYAKQHLQTFKAISVREDAGQKIVEELNNHFTSLFSGVIEKLGEEKSKLLIELLDVINVYFSEWYSSKK